MANPSRQGRSGRRESSDLRESKYFGFSHRIASRFFGTPALTSALTDDFNDNSIDATKWINNYGARILEQNKRLEISTLTSAGYYAFETKENASLLGSSVSVKLTNAGDQSLVTYKCYPISISNAEFSNKVEWVVSGNVCYMFKRIGGVATNLGGSFAYNAVTHLYFRIREQEGIIYFDTSANGTAWTNRRTTPNPMSLNAIKVLMQVGNYGVEATGTAAYWEDYNVDKTVAPNVEQIYTYESGSGGYLATHTIAGVNAALGNLVVVGVANRNISTDVTSVTIDGVTATRTAIRENTSVAGVEYFYAYNAAFGSSISVVVNTPAFKLVSAVVWVISNANSSPIDLSANDGAFSQTGSVAITPTPATSLILGLTNQQSYQAFSPIANTTEDADFDHADTNLGGLNAFSRRVLTAAAYTLGSTWTGNDNWVTSLLAIKVAGVGGSFSQSCVETLVLVDVTNRTSSRRLTDALTLVDTVQKTTSRILLDALTLVDTTRRTTTRIITETITLVDTVATKITARILFETITMVDVIAKSTSRTITEVVSLVDTIIRTTTRAFTEVISLVDTFAGVKITTKALIESIVLVDTMTKFTSRTISEVLALVDSIRRTTTRTFTDALSLADTVSKTSGKQLTEALSLIDTIAKTTTRRLTETVTMVDTMIRTTTRRFLEAIALVDTFTFSRVIVRTLSESISLVDTIRKTVSKVARETLTLVDTFLGEKIVFVIISIGNWITRSLTGLAKTVKGERKTHAISTSKQVHVLLLSERSFTVSATEISHTNRSNITP